MAKPPTPKEGGNELHYHPLGGVFSPKGGISNQPIDLYLQKVARKVAEENKVL